MPALSTLLTLLFICCVAAILWWGFGRLTLPEPVKTILMVIVALVLLYAIYGVFTGHQILLR